MADTIEFRGDYEDQSTDKGFQFEFHCQRCNNGVRTKFAASTVGTVTGALQIAGGLLGGIFGKAADIGNEVRSASWEKAHDSAFQNAWEEVKPHFVQCPRCSAWVCRQSCWNERKGMCKECAPDLGVEMAKAQSDRSVEEIHRHAAMAEEDKKLSTQYWRENIRASCPKCEAPLESNARFCPSCGEQLKSSSHCTQCGAKLSATARFCAECGTAVPTQE